MIKTISSGLYAFMTLLLMTSCSKSFKPANEPITSDVADSCSYSFHGEISCQSADSSKWQFQTGNSKVAIDQLDNIYILDFSKTIIKLDSSKAFVDRWFPSDYKNDDRFLAQNSDRLHLKVFGTYIETDLNNNVYVSNYGRIHKLNQNGKYIRAFSIKAREFAVNSKGVIYAISEKSLVKYAPDGSYDKHIVRLSPYGGTPLGSIAIDSKDTVYVVNSSINKIIKLSPNDTILDSLSGPGQGYGEIVHPPEISIDKDDNILIADKASQRIQCIDSQGRFIYALEQDPITKDKIIWPHSVAGNSKGSVFIISQHSGLVEYNANNNYVGTLGTEGDEPGCIIKPINLLITENGFIYIQDVWRSKILKFTLDGIFVKSLFDSKKAYNTNTLITDISEASNGTVFISSQNQENTLIAVRENGERIRDFSRPFLKTVKKGYSIQSFKADRLHNDRYYLLSANVLQCVSSSGQLLHEVKPQKNVDKHARISTFEIDNKGYLILGFTNHCIQKYDSEGNFVTQLVSPDTSQTFPGYLSALDIDDAGNIYTLAKDCHAYIFNPSGKLVSTIELQNRLTPCPNIDEDIVVSRDGTSIYVSDVNNYRVEIYKKDSM